MKHTQAFLYALREMLPQGPEVFERQAQNKADYIESVLLSDGETPHIQRHAAGCAAQWFIRHGVIQDDALYSDRRQLIEAVKAFSYDAPTDRNAEQERDAMNQMEATI